MNIKYVKAGTFSLNKNDFEIGECYANTRSEVFTIMKSINGNKHLINLTKDEILPFEPYNVAERFKRVNMRMIIEE